MSSDKKFQAEDIDCRFTLDLCARLSVDALCCLPCCCFCGGCCGRYKPCAAGLFPEESKDIEKGSDTFMVTCWIQLLSGILMPSTLCGCLWACCGTATPCVKCVYNKVKKVESDNKAVEVATVAPPTQQNMEA